MARRKVAYQKRKQNKFAMFLVAAVLLMLVVAVSVRKHQLQENLDRIRESEAEIERLEKKLNNEGFTSRAPAAVVDAERAKLEKYKEKREGVIAAIAKLG